MPKIIRLLVLFITLTFSAAIMIIWFSSCDSETEKIATVQDMWVSSLPSYQLIVDLKPTSLAQPNFRYKVDLYEKGQLRESNTISWNQPELNVFKTKFVYFPISRSEYDAYLMKSVSHIFTVEVH